MIKEKQQPSFSIITVCYNEERNIRKTCESISNQTYKIFEWIVIDGKSTDNTIKIIKEYKNNITSLTSEKDSGIYDAMNKGIAKAKGEYILFLNGGDSLENKHVLKNTLKFIKKDKEISDIYYGDLIYDNGEIVDYSKATLDKKFFINKTISHQSTFIRRKLFSKYGRYNQEYEIVADFDFWIKTIVIGGIKKRYLPFTISIFDTSGISTDYKIAKKQMEERNKVLLKYKIINKREAVISQIKGFFLTVFKRIRIYNYLRRTYRSIVKR